MNPFLRAYFKAFDFLTRENITLGRYQPWQAHTQFATVLSTGILMWGYAFLAYFRINQPIPGMIGFAMATLHLLSPLFLKWPGNIYLASHALIFAGIVHQGTFAYYTGGFNSNVLIWFGILPMLAGIMLGRIGIVIWGLATTIVSSIFLAIHLGLLGPNISFSMGIDEKGWLIAQGMMVFGWIFLSTALIYLFVLLMEHNDNQKNQKNTQIRTLVRVLCHDISNPLTTIKNRLELIQSKLEDQEVSQSLNKVDRPIEAIRSIIEQIRNWEAIESGKEEVQFESVSIPESIEFVLDVFQEKFQDKELELNLEVLGEHHTILADKTTLQSQIFSNIISNAIKFSDNGSKIDIVIKEDGDKVTASFKDYGLGIPEPLLKDLFDATKKTTRLGTQGERGTGFGMPIVKTYVEKLGGMIKVSSKCREQGDADSGTLFELSFKKS